MSPQKLLLLVILAAQSISSHALTLSQEPLFISSTEPRVMLLMSRDHELTKKAYTDYSDLDPVPDGVLETTYKDSINYYGYFNSNKCYTYANERFSPAADATGLDAPYNHQCSGQWSGNFLNWATMTRMDVVRKVLYGGYRSTDNAGIALGDTVLERQMIPNDVHSFSKVFSPSGGAVDVAKYTPYSEASITLCNVTDVAATIVSRAVDTSTYPPLIKVASGAWPDWAMTEITQCVWREQRSDALTTRPKSADHRLTGDSDLIARVAVCAPDHLEENCKSYNTRANPPVESIKPTGLLQKYGDVDADRRVRFGLITGSYNKNSDGGVLRKNIKLLTNNENVSLTSASICGVQADDAATTNLKPGDDEIDVCTGQFINQGANDKGIIKTLNRLRIADWKYIYNAGIVGSGSYDTCNAANLIAGTNNTCRDWGNPLSEMYYEALRYFAGEDAATANYATVGDNAIISGLQQDTWNANSDPLPDTEWCAISNIITLSTGLNSMDTNTFAYDIADLAGASVTNLTNAVGDAEGISGNIYIGSNGVVANNSCTAKAWTTLDQVAGICPEIPQMRGGYKIAGLTKSNLTVDLRPEYLGDAASYRTKRWSSMNANWVARQPLNNYSVALAENVPSFEIKVGDSTVSLVPACRSGDGDPTNVAGRSVLGTSVCSLTDLRVEAQTATSGRFLASWEDSTAGSDYDMDAVSRLEYRVVGEQIFVSVSVVQAATGASMKLGYSINGTDQDGTHFLINIPGTGTGGNLCAGFNLRQFSLISSPSSYGVNCGVGVPVTVSCPAYNNYLGNAQVDVLPTGVDMTANYACVKPDGTAGTNCGCPKEWVYNAGTTAATLLKSPLWYAAKYGLPAASWDLLNNDTEAATPDGVPDNYFEVRNPTNLHKALSKVFDAASEPDASAASVATNSTNLDIKSRVFQARFSSADWSGQLLSLRLENLITTQEWDAGELLPAAASRVIITKGAADGVPFQYASLTTTQQDLLKITSTGGTDALDSQRVSYLRGTDVAGFRPRPVSKLGDIVNSSPWYVAEAKAGFSDVDYGGYSAFRSAKQYRRPVVYVGGNDGMLHGFDASVNYSDDDHPEGLPVANQSGKEIFAYVPSAVYANLSKLSHTNYNRNHRYFVDGSPMAADAYVNAAWRTVLVGGLGGGGKGIYALDVTDPGSVDPDTGVATGGFTEANAANLLLWEFTEADHADMGHVYNYPAAFSSTNTVNQAKQIVRLRTDDTGASKWAVIVGNGYNSASGKAVLYIMFITDGINGWAASDTVKIVVDSAGNGLSTPLPYDSNADGFVDTVYAGDLKGNLWKFKVGPTGDETCGDSPSPCSPENWAPAFSTSTWDSATYTQTCSTCVPLFVAKDSDDNRQPIVWPPEVTLHPTSGEMVTFGTGKYIEPNDNLNDASQTYYGVWDNGAAVSRSDLLGRSVASTVELDGGFFRKITHPDQDADDSIDKVDYAGTQRGWYFDLPTTRERTTGVTKIDGGLVVFNTFIPSVAACDAGGTGWLMALDYLEGTDPLTRVFDTDNDLDVDSNDESVAGYQIGAALGGTTLVRSVNVNQPSIGVSSLTSGELKTNLIQIGNNLRGRINWREIVQ